MSIVGGHPYRVPACALAWLAVLLAGDAVAQDAAHTLPSPAERLPAVAGPEMSGPQAPPPWSDVNPAAVHLNEPLPAIGPLGADRPAFEPLPVETQPLIDVPFSDVTIPNDSAPFDAFSDSYEEIAPANFTWQVGPSGIIYRSYLAGPLEPRIGITPFFSENHSYWDATVGGRGGVLRYGDCDPLHPQGWQLDVYGAAIVRLDPENRQDLMGSDYVFGFPITYGVDNWQFKFGYSHLSSHLGDEYAIRYPGTLEERINYVRDGIVFGASWYPVEACRLYGELDAAVINVSGGAEPLAFQFGTELSHPGPTGLHGSPFFALNARMRQEIDFGGDVTAQTGWLWRGITGKTFRLGAHYYNGHSSQAQFYQTSEQQIGIGLWYDF
jgi:hypothetical protein